MKYYVKFNCHTYYEVEVEADNEGQAREKALEKYLSDNSEKQLLENMERYEDVEINKL